MLLGVSMSHSIAAQIGIPIDTFPFANKILSRMK